MPKALDLTNKVFGNLKCIQKAPTRNKKTYWECECLLCGTHKIIQTCHLTDGRTTSCGQHNENNLFNTSKEKQCLICGEKFITNNPKRKYCFNCSPNDIPAADRLRNIKRIIKHKLIMYKGGKCEICGYDKCEGALQFHHLNPQEKEFTISQVNLNESEFSFENLLKEVDKCQLLCANCHAEQHYKIE